MRGMAARLGLAEPALLRYRRSPRAALPCPALPAAASVMVSPGTAGPAGPALPHPLPRAVPSTAAAPALCLVDALEVPERRAQ